MLFCKFTIEQGIGWGGKKGRDRARERERERKGLGEREKD